MSDSVDKDMAVMNQVNSDNEGPDLSEAMEKLGIKVGEDTSEGDTHLDGGEGELPTVDEVSSKIAEEVTKQSESGQQNKEASMKDLEVDFDEESGEFNFKQKAEKNKAATKEGVKTSEGESNESSEKEESSTKATPIGEYIKQLDDSTTVIQKIDGEEVEVNLKEALQKTMNEYAGQEAVGKKFTELDNAKKEWYAEKDAIVSDLKEVGQQLQVDNIEGAFEALGRLTGTNTPGFLIKEKLISQLKPEIERRAQMTNEELKNEYLKSQNSYYEKQNESEAKRREAKASREALEQSLNSVRETHKISPDEWQKAFTELDKNTPKDQDITIKDVKEAVLSKRESAKVESTVSSVLDGVEGVTDETRAYMADIVRKHPEFDQATLKAIVDEATKPQDDSGNKKKEVNRDLQEKVDRNNQLSSEKPDEDQLNMDRIQAILESDD